MFTSDCRILNSGSSYLFYVQTMHANVFCLYTKRGEQASSRKPSEGHPRLYTRPYFFHNVIILIFWASATRRKNSSAALILRYRRGRTCILTRVVFTYLRWNRLLPGNKTAKVSAPIHYCIRSIRHPFIPGYYYSHNVSYAVPGQRVFDHLYVNVDHNNGQQAAGSSVLDARRQRQTAPARKSHRDQSCPKKD